MRRKTRPNLLTVIALLFGLGVIAVSFHSQANNQSHPKLEMMAYSSVR